MPGIGLLHGINRERPDSIDAQLIDVLLAHSVSLADQGIPATWVQGLDAAPADKAPKNCTAKKGWLACAAGVPAILRRPAVEEAPPSATQNQSTTPDAGAGLFRQALIHGFPLVLR
jgi:hypothetical protein